MNLFERTPPASLPKPGVAEWLHGLANRDTRTRDTAGIPEPQSVSWWTWRAAVIRLISVYLVLSTQYLVSLMNAMSLGLSLSRTWQDLSPHSHRPL
jgi:hypothetical protein